jgi:carbamoyltransferase
VGAVALGLNLDLYDAGVALACDGHLLYAANEERFTRRKNQGGFPIASLEGALASTGLQPGAITRIVVAGTTTPPLPMRLFPALHDRLRGEAQGRRPGRLRSLADFVIFHTPLSSATADSLWGRSTRPLLAPLLRRRLPEPLRGVPLDFVEHHHAHAAGAYCFSGFDEALVLTGDGMGDGLSFTVSRWCEGKAERLWSARALDSFGHFYEFLCEAAGFTPCRDEGKITGLAAAGNAAHVPLPPPFRWEGDRLRYDGPHGRAAIDWMRRMLFERHAREDIAAWAQECLEHFVCEITRRWCARTGLRQLAVSGGIFANVKLNQRLHALPEVDRLFVYPNMGDGGLSAGALAAVNLLHRGALRNVFLGDEFSHDALRGALQRAGIPAEEPEDLPGAIADRLARGEIVGRFTGRMEWGPRALGNRSILAAATERGITQRLNTLLRRSDFMPFAPAVLEEDADHLLEDAQKARHAAEFMTVCFRCTPAMCAQYPAVVHVDGTARAQIVRRETNPEFHAVLSACKARTGHPILLNTSFNIHEEPIIRTPEEAIHAFLRARLDWLALGPCLAALPRQA